MKNIIKLFLFLVFLQIKASNVHAIEGTWDSADEMQARLISTLDSVGRDTSEIQAAVQIRQSSGWHSYWRSPGDSGLAPQFDWSQSKNIENVEVSFPIPKRFDEMGLTTFGYDGELIFPIAAKLKNSSEPANLNLQLATMVCKDICIPQMVTLTLDFPKGDGASSRKAAMIDFAKSKIPTSGNTDSLKIENISISEDEVMMDVFSKRGFDRSDIFLEIDEFALTAEPQLNIDSEDNQKASISFAIPDDISKEFTHDPSPFSDAKIIATFTDGRNAIEVSRY